jgi:dihydrofolate reductase
MRRVIVKMEMSLDGFVGARGVSSGWPAGYFDDDEFTAYELGVLESAGVHAMGRVSYQDMAPYWPTSNEPFAAPMNEIPKAVFSRSLTEADWPETRIYPDLEEGMASLRSEDGAPVLVHGGSDLVQQLTRLDLVDELRINVHPEVFGDGLPLFGAAAKWSLENVRRYGGSLALTYTPRR